MTRKLLQSDIERAAALMAEGCPDADVVLALTKRGVSEERATEVVSSLRQGSHVEPDPLVLNHPPVVAVDPGEAEEADGAAEGSSRRRRRRRGSNRQQRAEQRVMMIAIGLTLLVCAIIVALVWFLQSDSKP